MVQSSFQEILGNLAAKHSVATAVTCGDNVISFRALDRLSNCLARVYQKMGVEEDDFVTIALPNGIEFFLATFAVLKLGATPQPVSSRLPKAELAAIVELVNARIVIGVSAEDAPGREVVEMGYVPSEDISDKPLPEKIAKHWKAPTSGGSTGRPKLIVSAEPATVDLDRPSGLRQANDKAVLIPGPLYHNGPFLMSIHALLRGNKVVVMERFNAESCLALIDQHHIDWTVMVPTMMHRIWRLGENVRNRYDLSSLRILLHIAAACPQWLKKEWIDWLGAGKIHELYGGTEGQGSTWITGEDWLAHKGSVGRVQEGFSIKIVGEDMTEQPSGEEGDIYFLPDAGPGTTYHYIGAEPDAIEGGWETLGDIGYMDNEGYLYLCDRRKDLIISGGANIYPAEVEGAIEAHPAVRSSIVVGLADKDLGQRVHALVDAPEGLSEESLLAHLEEKLVRYKIPRSIEFVNTPLRDDAGKARRWAIAAAREEVES